MSLSSIRSAFAIFAVAIALVSCSNPQGLDSVAVSPSSQSLAVGQTVQFTATGTFGNAKKPSTQDITKAVTWSSSLPSVATVNAAGLATAVSPGTTTITASATAFNGPISSSAVLTVPGATTGSGSSGGSGGTGTITSGADILSLTIIPSGIVFGQLTQSGQFLAIGTFATPPLVRDVTNQVTWLTSEPNKFPVSNNIASGAAGAGTQNGGVVSAYEASVGNVGATITAEFLDKTGSLAVATASVGCPYKAPTATDPGSCNNFVPQLLSTLTIYNEGLNSAVTGNWLVTAVSAVTDPSIPGSYIADPSRTPATPTVLHCGPGWAKNGQTGGSICTVTYPLPDPILFPNARTRVILTAPAQSGVTFGGWSSNCKNATLVPAGPNTCTIDLQDTDATVGAIFN
jgi:hypothetical protein